MGLLDRAGARLTARPEDAESSSSTPAPSSTPPSRSRSRPSSRWPATKPQGRAKKLIVAGCLVERYRDEIRKNIPEVDAVVGTGELESILQAAGLNPAAAPTRTPSPFTILTTTRPASSHRTPNLPIGNKNAGIRHEKGSPRSPRPRSSTAASFATPGLAPRIPCPPTSTTTPPRVFSPRLARRPTSKSPRAATTPAASASSPTSAAASAPAASSLSSLKPSSSSPAAQARSPSSARTPPATAKTSASATASPPSSTPSPASKASAGSASSTLIPTASPAASSRSSPPAPTSANISTCPSSTPRPPSSSA